jgi:hypothetical protein
MTKPTRMLSRRQQSCVLYSMHLTGEVSAPGWSMRVERRALLRALGRLEGRLVLTVCERGLSVRSRAGRVDLAGVGFWASPVSVAAGRLRRALACDYGGYAHLEFGKGRLMVNASCVPAREV